MAETDGASGWRVPYDPVQYVAVFGITAVQLAAFSSIDLGLRGHGRVRPWLWGLLMAALLTLTADFGDRKLRSAVRGRSDAERQAVRQSLRTGVLPPDGSFDAYIEWVIQLIGYKSHLLGRAPRWLAGLIAVCCLVAALVTGEPLWLPIAVISIGQSALLRWDRARMDACFAGLERQLAARVPV